MTSLGSWGSAIELHLHMPHHKPMMFCGHSSANKKYFIRFFSGCQVFLKDCKKTALLFFCQSFFPREIVKNGQKTGRNSDSAAPAGFLLWGKGPSLSQALTLAPSGSGGAAGFFTGVFGVFRSRITISPPLTPSRTGCPRATRPSSSASDRVSSTVR